jgi:hypothetical protein
VKAKAILVTRGGESHGQTALKASSNSKAQQEEEMRKEVAKFLEENFVLRLLCTLPRTRIVEVWRMLGVVNFPRPGCVVPVGAEKSWQRGPICPNPGRSKVVDEVPGLGLVRIPPERFEFQFDLN